MKKQIAFLMVYSFFLSSCASIPAVQGRVRNLAAKGDFDYASSFVSHLKQGVYGKNNRLLEAMDRGMVYHLSGDYHQSVKEFEKAKLIYDELYTKSLSKIAASWLWNDASLPYPGEDFERVAINIFQALNFIALGEYDEALVEARNVQSVLQLINDRYPKGQKNVYDDDAFVRMLMGILYEAFGRQQDINDAFLSYKKAFRIYDDYFSLKAPDLLKEDLLSTAAWMGQREFDLYQKKCSGIAFRSLADRKNTAEVYIILYRGQIVNKMTSTIVLPGMDGLLTRISFPRYRKSFHPDFHASVKAQGSDGVSVEADFAKVQDFDAIARANLENRRLRILAKAVARPLTKQLIVEAAEDTVRDKAGETAGDLFNYAGNFYLLYSEQADLRAWETLPSKIYMARLVLLPGEYDFFIKNDHIEKFLLKKSDRKFIIHWIAY